MRAALLTEINKPLEITEVTPGPLAPGQVFVRVLVSGICGAQLQEIRGEKGTHFPRLLGHEGCGIVEEVGPGVMKLKVGQKVVMHWRKGSGMESVSPTYVLPDSREITGGQVTTFSEFSICSENRLTAVPSETPNELCALLGCGLSTALGVMENEAKLKAGESVLVIGCGGVGLNCIRVAKIMGAAHITGMDLNADKREQAFSSGATAFAEKLSPPWFNDFDVVIDTVGSEDIFGKSVQCMNASGRYILVGQPKPQAMLRIPNARDLFDGEGKMIKATQGGGFIPDRDIPRYVQMWRSGHLKINGIITHRFPFSEINKAIETVQAGNAGRALLEMI